MNIFRSLENIKKKKRALVLYCLLDRIPIIVYGEDPNYIDELIIELSGLINFRKDLVFYTDFISNTEYNNLFLNENNDYQSIRIQIRCPSNVAIKAISELDSLDSMIIGIEVQKEKILLNLIKELIRAKVNSFLEISIDSEKLRVNIVGINEKIIDLDMEERIFQKISEDTEKSINKMKRVISEEVHKSQLDNELKETLLDFEVEKGEIKKNIFQEEIQNFYLGAKRAFFILSKLNFLHNMNINSKIGSKTLLEAIDYEDGSIKRILSFIMNEWREDFSRLIQNNKLTFIGEKIQSLWG